MKRRKFLQFCGCSIVLVGCGSDSLNTLGNGTSGSPNAPSIGPAALARSSNEAIFDFDAAGNLAVALPEVPS